MVYGRTTAILERSDRVLHCSHTRSCNVGWPGDRLLVAVLMSGVWWKRQDLRFHVHMHKNKTK